MVEQKQQPQGSLRRYICGCGTEYASADGLLYHINKTGHPRSACTVKALDTGEMRPFTRGIKKGTAVPPAVNVQWGIRFAYQVGQEVLVRDGTRWMTKKIEKITVYRGQAGINPPLCPHCNMPLLGEPRFWFKGLGNVPITEIMAREDIDARLGPEPVTIPLVGVPVPIGGGSSDSLLLSRLQE